MTRKSMLLQFFTHLTCILVYTSLCLFSSLPEKVKDTYTSLRNRGILLIRYYRPTAITKNSLFYSLPLSLFIGNIFNQKISLLPYAKLSFLPPLTHSPSHSLSLSLLLPLSCVKNNFLYKLFILFTLSFQPVPHVFFSLPLQLNTL